MAQTYPHSSYHYSKFGLEKTIPIPPPNSIPKLLQIITYTPPPGTVPLVTIAEMDNVVRTSIMYDKNKITKVPDIPKEK